jgi:predicted ATP-grasp superfamily ATP-dependent carboligase
MRIVGTDTNRFFLELPPVDSRYKVPPARDTESYIAALNRVIEKERIEFIHPQPDIEVDIISENRERLSAKTFLPSKDAIRTCHDKFESNRVFKQAGVPVPEALKLSDGADSLDDSIERVGLPVWLRTRDPRYAFCMKIDSLKQARMWVDFWMDKSAGVLHWSDFTVNEYLPGRVVGWQSIWKDGEMITSQGRVRLEWVKTSPVSPTGAGTSAVQMTVSSDELDDIATRAVNAVDKKPQGVLSVDLAEDRNGNFRVTEINLGRFYTTCLFFPECGVNVPYMFLLAAYGEEKKIHIERHSPIPDGYYWIRNLDADPIVVKGEKWRSIEA